MNSKDRCGMCEGGVVPALRCACNGNVHTCLPATCAVCIGSGVPVACPIWQPTAVFHGQSGAHPYGANLGYGRSRCRPKHLDEEEVRGQVLAGPLGKLPGRPLILSSRAHS